MQEVQPGGPADKAGLKAGDIITSIDGRAIKDGDDLVNDIASRRPGSTIRLGLHARRQGDGHHGNHRRSRQGFCRSEQPAASKPIRKAEAAPAKPSWALVVHEITQAMAAKIHAPGVVIDSVRTGSFADLQGLEPGLVITHVNRQPTGSKEQFDAVVSKLKTGDDVVFEVIDPHHPEQGINYIGGTL